MEYDNIIVAKPDLVKFYSFVFEGIEKQVTIEATNAINAREALKNTIPLLPELYHGKKVIGQSVCHPIEGVSTKKVNGRQYVWVGMEQSRNGWQEIQ